MIGIVLIAHKPLASALASAAVHVYACAPERANQQVRVLDVEPDAEVPGMVEAARRLCREADQGSGVLVLTDAFGASPGNIAAQLATPGQISVVAGVNLPMLLRAMCYRDGSLSDTVDKALAGGTQGVLQVGGSPVQNQGQRAEGHDQARLRHQQ